MAQGAQLASFDPKSCFSAGRCQLAGRDRPIPLSELDLSTSGQVLFQGASGLGKTTFLRHLFYGRHRDPRKIHVFIRAVECRTEGLAGNAVVEAL